MKHLRKLATFHFTILALFVFIFAGLGSKLIFFGHAATSCTTTVSSTSALSSAVSSAADGGIVCVSAGSYGSVSLTRTGTHNNYVTVEPDPAQDPNGAGKVTFTGLVSLTGPWIKWSNFYETAGITLPAPYQGTSAKNIDIDHNDISPGIDGGNPDCTVPDAPGSCSGGFQPLQYITVTGNKIHDAGAPTSTEDALHFNNYQHLTISYNSIYNNIQAAGGSAPHTDSLQTVWGGSDLTVDHNYFHDSHDEAWILKDGDEANVTFTDNLIVRQAISDGSVASESSWIQDTHNTVFRNNTMWSVPDGMAVFDTADNNPPSSCSGDPYCSTSPYSIAIDHNVMQNFGNQAPGGTLFTTMNGESYNIFAHSPTPSNFSLSGTSSINSNPTFKCATSGSGGTNICGNGTPAGDDYELASNPNGIGIDWSPAAQTYGPTNNSGSTPITGDLNGDGHVNIFDLSIFLNHWQQTGTGLPEDFNNDNSVNIFDLSILLSHYGT